MSNIVGVGLQGQADIAELSQYDFGCYVCLSDDGYSQVASLRSISPGAVILVRIYDTNIINKDPQQWAEHCANEYSQFSHITRHIVPANETNIEGGSNDASGYQYLNDWFLSFASAFKQLAPDSILHFPAVSPNGSEFMLPQYCSRAVDASDVLDIHVYWGDKPVSEAVSSYFNQRAPFAKWTMLTEYNRVWNHYDQADADAYASEVVNVFLPGVAQDPYLIGTAAFLWNTGDGRHEAFRHQGQPVAAAMGNMYKPQSAWVESDGLLAGIPDWMIIAAGVGVLLLI